MASFQSIDSVVDSVKDDDTVPLTPLSRQPSSFGPVNAGQSSSLGRPDNPGPSNTSDPSSNAGPSSNASQTNPNEANPTTGHVDARLHPGHGHTTSDSTASFASSLPLRLPSRKPSAKSMLGASGSGSGSVLNSGSADGYVHKSTLWASKNDLRTASVMLYPSSARIVQSFKAQVKPGLNEITILGLTATLDVDTLRASVNNDALVNNITHKTISQLHLLTYLPASFSTWSARSKSLHEDPDQSDPYHAVLQTLETADREKQKVLADLDTVQHQIQALDDYVKTLTVSAGEVSVSQLAQELEVYAQRRATVFDKYQQHQAKLSDLDQYLAKLDEHKQSLEEERRFVSDSVWEEGDATSGERRGGLGPGSSIPEPEEKLAVVITVSVPDKCTEVSCLLSYHTDAASWSPSYDLVLTRSDGAGGLILNGQISNRTGEDWSRCPITLSTTDDEVARLYEPLPKLEPWKITLRDSYPERSLHQRVLSGSSSQATVPQHSPTPSISHSNLFNSILSSRDPNERERKPGGTSLFGSRQNSTVNRRVPTRASSKQGSTVSQKQTQTSPPPVVSHKIQRSVSTQSQAQAQPQSQHQNQASQPQSPGQETDHTLSRRNSMANTIQTVAIPGTMIAPGQTTTTATVHPTSATSASAIAAAIMATEGHFDMPQLYHLVAAVPSSTTPSKHEILYSPIDIDFYYTIVPKCRTTAFARVKVHNSGSEPLFPGSVGVTLDGVFYGRLDVPYCAPGDHFFLNLGVDPEIRVAYAKPHIRQITHAREEELLTEKDNEKEKEKEKDKDKEKEKDKDKEKEKDMDIDREVSRTTKLVYSRAIYIVNNQASHTHVIDADRQESVSLPPPGIVSLRVFDELPVAQHALIDVKLLTPAGIGVGEEAVDAGIGLSTLGTSGLGAQAEWGQARASMQKEGEVRWDVELLRGRGVALQLAYEVSMPEGEKIVLTT